MLYKKVLIVKLASMGDLVLALPALTDAMRAHPGISFDWMIDKHFHEVALWHPAIDKIIQTNHRKWRSNPFCRKTLKEVKSTVCSLRQRDYDLVIDAHGGFKSALLSLFAKGPITGWDRKSTCEAGSHVLYSKKIAVSKQQHAIDRIRLLLAGALHYPLPPTKPEYTLCLDRLVRPSILLPPSYLVFVPIASTPLKLWEEEHWHQLIQRVQMPVFVPWGNEEEKRRAERLEARSNGIAKALPRLSLSEIGYLIRNALGVVSLDTGLSHIAAAVGTPAITLYGPTDPRLTGTIGDNQTWIEESSLSQITSDRVFNTLKQAILQKNLSS